MKIAIIIAAAWIGADIILLAHWHWFITTMRRRAAGRPCGPYEAFDTMPAPDMPDGQPWPPEPACCDACATGYGFCRCQTDCYSAYCMVPVARMAADLRPWPAREDL